MIVDVSKCHDLIPEKYFNASEDYEQSSDGAPDKIKLTSLNDATKVPLDLAFCRWVAVERGVTFMPCSLFFHKESKDRKETFIRVAICKGMDHTVKAFEKLGRRV